LYSEFDVEKVPGTISEKVPGTISGSEPPLTRPASILIFTARPGSIATARSTALCYAVSDAVRARIEPGIGEVRPTSTLKCLRVAPARTTTYTLTASGGDGREILKQLVIVVM
jgi:hypothetical protein